MLDTAMQTASTVISHAKICAFLKGPDWVGRTRRAAAAVLSEGAKA
ncbi:hypothetical protein N825_12790 [Skermanella stibiiresistens SB22]|uniref:Uncharacterized protein n=1 Tax=Skermanella stibiiresistens SB22 TaxID=1385369 RepID=W9GX58_9PROT|nr:hypothetical protein N825_12790 [Skermanella stibiiresistens SB22]